MPSKSARKKSGWKDVQFKHKIKRKTKLALIVLGAVLSLLIVSWTIRFTQNLFSPGKLSTDKPRSYTWNGEFNLNLLIRTNSVSLVSFIPKEERVVIINIPDETFLEVSRGFGRWQLRSIYELGQSQKEVGGNKLLSETLTSIFGLPIDGFLDFSRLNGQQSAASVIETLRKNPLSGFNLLSALKTDLTPWELFKFKLKLSSVRFDKVKILDLNKLNVLDKGNLLDGTPVFTPDPVKIDSILSDLADPVIVSEHKSIAVFNATGEPQLAQKWARLITNLGGNVIITTNAKKSLEKTQVAGDGSLTLKRLKEIFDLDCQNNPKCGKISLEDEDLVSSRAQINLFLGKDYLDR